MDLELREMRELQGEFRIEKHGFFDCRTILVHSITNRAFVQLRSPWRVWPSNSLEVEWYGFCGTIKRVYNKQTKMRDLCILDGKGRCIALCAPNPEFEYSMIKTEHETLFLTEEWRPGFVRFLKTKSYVISDRDFPLAEVCSSVKVLVHQYKPGLEPALACAMWYWLSDRNDG